MIICSGRAEAMVDDDVFLFLYLLFPHQGSTFIGKGVLTESSFAHRIALTNLPDRYLKKTAVLFC